MTTITFHVEADCNIHPSIDDGEVSLRPHGCVPAAVPRAMCALGQRGGPRAVENRVRELRGHGAAPGVPGQRGGAGLPAAAGRVLLVALAQMEQPAGDRGPTGQ
ncbi:hypothetical protein ON010_g5574 [Phytophthora cinnamomi]|nr:hypothetical protein ON010_g5574 [Phytophthora cinnamomi]